jgi:UbiD family decarboxylase
MSYRDFRDFIAVAEQQGLLKRVQQTVDPSWEPGCFIKWAFQALSDEERFGLLFENVEGSAMPLCTGALGASRRTYALALSIEPEQINAQWENALVNPVKPVITDTAPCQEVVLISDEARLSELPIPTWTPGKDVGPYITTTLMTRTIDTDNQNTGVYRAQVRDDHHVVINMNPRRGGHDQCATWWAQGKAAPVAWVIGAEPAFQLAAVSTVPGGVQEMEVAGGLKGSPIELVKCLTNDIMVPANAEIIIEGELEPGDLDKEGPFGENLGFMRPVSNKPVARITAITHRKDAIYYGMASQMPPSESTFLQSNSTAGLLFKILRHDLSEQQITDFYVDETFGGQMAHGIIAMTPQYPGHGMKVGRMAAEVSALKRVTVVDDDVDIRDPRHMDWVMNARYNPSRDTVIIKDVFMRAAMDPSVEAVDGVKIGSKLVIDATRSVPEEEFSLPPKETMMKALESWKSAGLPEFTIPKRAQLRIDKS